MHKIRQYFREIGQMRQLVSDNRSLARYAIDITLSRFMRFIRLPRNRIRELRLNEGIRLTYRLNRGDIHSLREIWLDNSYLLPAGICPKTIVDLGANIGMSSLWLKAHYKDAYIIAVEPSPANSALVRTNFEANSIRGEVIDAAAAPADGTAYFTESKESDLGHLAEKGLAVKTVSMNTILNHLPEGRDIDLLKVDIEGGEWSLFFDGDLSWLNRVHSIIMEIHPPRDHQEFVVQLNKQGFDYRPPTPTSETRLDYFVRRNNGAPSGSERGISC